MKRIVLLLTLVLANCGRTPTAPVVATPTCAAGMAPATVLMVVAAKYATGWQADTVRAVRCVPVTP